MVGAQSYVERPPIAALAGIVSSVWIQQVAADAEPYVQRNIPSGAVELVCRVGFDPQVIGPLTGAFVDVLEPGTTVVGMRFHPGAAPAGDGLARLAADAGYADQPHLNRECLRLTGASPRAFLGEAEDHCGCGHDHAASFMPVLRARLALQ